MSAKAKLRIFIIIIVAIATAGFIATLFYAPSEGAKGFLFALARKAIFIVLALIIVTAVIKFKSVSRTDKISKYIFVGVVLYAGLVALIGFTAYGAYKDYKNDRKSLTLQYSDYDTYYSNYSKAGSLYYLKVNIDGNLETFCITKDTYTNIKKVDTIQLKYYPNTKVVYEVKAN